MFAVNQELFNANYYATEDIVVNQGGTDSSKTYTILQVLSTIAAYTQAPADDPIITILSASIPDSKRGAYRTFQNIARGNDFMNSRIAQWNLGDRTVVFKTGWVIEFLGATDQQAAKQGKRQYLFVNEANGVDWMVFWEMAKRTRIRTWLDYNPTAPFWAHENLIGTRPESNDLSATVKLIISDHRHNHFLSAKDHAKTENLRDPELWRVYARGLTGNLTGLIYTTWKEISDKDYPYDDPNIFGGLDMGYTNDPTAGVRLCRIGNKIFVKQLCYETGLSNERIVTIFKSEGFERTHPIYTEHDKDAIRDLRLRKLLAIPAKKSIAPGISKVKEFDIYYIGKEIAFERKKYMWIRDPTSGKFVNVPVDLDNHLMDAIRYGFYTHYYRKPV